MATEDVYKWVDEDGYDCALQRTEGADKTAWYITIIEPEAYVMSTVDLSRQQLVELRDKINEELEKVVFCPNCSGRHNDAYGKYCITCGTLIRKET